MNRILQLLFLWSSVLGSAVWAQGPNHAQASLFARAAGKTIKIAVVVDVDAGWHAYHGPRSEDASEDGLSALPTIIELTGIEATWGEWHYPKADVEVVDFGTPIKTFVHRGRFVVYRVGEIADGAKIEGLVAEIKGQTCTDGEGSVCTNYKESLTLEGAGNDKIFAALPSDLTAKPGASASPAGGANQAAGASKSSGTGSSTSSSGGEDEDGEDASLFWFLLSAVWWGFFTLLMPCTYPMIPITISYFTKQATSRKTSTLPLSIAYGAGIVLIFVLIGVLVGPLIITFATHPVTNLIIGGMFIVFALSLFGLMNLQPPAFLLNVAGSASQRGGYVGVFLMGATLVITSFTCTAPFVGTLLSTAGASADLTRVVLGMGVFGATIAVPFVFLSMVPGKVKALPKSGDWMKTLKVWLGFVEIAAAMKFLSNVDLVWGWGWLSRENFLALWMGTFFCAAAYLFAWIRLKGEYGDEDGATISPGRMVGGIGTLLLAVYCGYGMLGHSMDPVMTAIIPNYSSRIGGGAGTAAESVGHVIIKDDFEGALARAKAEGKELLANFTGFT